MTTVLKANSPVESLRDGKPFYSFDDVFVDTLLVDLSHFARTGVRGLEAADDLLSRGIELPSSANKGKVCKQWMVLALSANEYWLLPVIGSANPNPVMPNFADSGNISFPVLCQDSHAWFVLKSRYKAEILAKLCGVDLREPAFAIGDITQTVIAGVNSIIFCHQIEQQTVFSILCDRSQAHYLWQVINDAMTEFV